jgi:carbamate kinase
VEAVIVVGATGRRAAIGALDQIEVLLTGEAGTQVQAD